jgi:hypothetical protein
MFYVFLLCHSDEAQKAATTRITSLMCRAKMMKTPPYSTLARRAQQPPPTAAKVPLAKEKRFKVMQETVGGKRLLEAQIVHGKEKHLNYGETSHSETSDSQDEDSKPESDFVFGWRGYALHQLF